MYRDSLKSYRLLLPSADSLSITAHSPSTKRGAYFWGHAALTTFDTGSREPSEQSRYIIWKDLHAIVPACTACSHQRQRRMRSHSCNQAGLWYMPLLKCHGTAMMADQRFWSIAFHYSPLLRTHTLYARVSDRLAMGCFVVSSRISRRPLPTMPTIAHSTGTA